MHDFDKAIRAAMMTAHRYARGGYADGGEADSVLMQERDESTYGPTNLDERRQRVQEMSNAQNVATQQYPGDFLEAPQGYITPAKAVRWVNTDAGPMAVDAEGNSLPLIQQPGVLPLYRDPTIDSVRTTMPRMADITGNMMGAPLGMTARRVIQAGMTGERPAANVLNIFAGENAKTADLAALDTAKKMASAGADQNQIIKETGWFQGPDEKWRFEIPDFKSRVTDQVFNNIKEKGIHEGPLSAGLEHYKLYEAYPQLNEMQATFGASAKPRGSYSPWSKDIAVEGPSTASQRSTALHEAQHAVQQIEGFARGADNIFLKPNTPAWDIYQERLKAIKTPMTVEEFEKAGIGSPEYTYLEYLKQTKDSVKNNAPMLDRAAQDYAVQEAYRRSAGETEARNVQARRNMEPTELQSKEPWTTQSVPNKEQIVQFHNTEPQMSVGPAERAENLAKFKSENVEDVPPIVYHGTGNDIHQFDTTKGAWFTDTPSLASEYANKPGGNVVPAHIALKNPIEFVHAEQRKPIGEVISTALSGAHDLSAEQINAAKPIVNILRERYGKNARPLFEYWNNDPDITKLFKTLGYDGISVFEKADRKAKTWSIFSPEQAKSAIGNAGTFNPKSPKLNEARGGTIPFGPEAAQRAVQIAKQQAGRR